MNFTKPPLTLEEQANLLLVRGMAGDRNLMVERLAVVNYYRLSGYWYPFRNPDDTFQVGTSFEMVWRRYTFDRQLRLQVMDAIERIEVAVRTLLAYQHARLYGPFAYAERQDSLPGKTQQEWEVFVCRVEEETDRSKEIFVQHFKENYGDCHLHLPVWMATEIMSFGNLLTFFKGSTECIKKAIATKFRVPAIVFESWLLALNTIRNICAHHGRLWNREFGTKPKIPPPSKYPDWHVPVSIPKNRIFAILTISRYCLSQIAPQSSWPSRLFRLLEAYPDIPLGEMGFPDNWRQCPIWREYGDET